MTTTSSDEQYRLQKACAGAQGMNEQDAVDEETDNGIDEKAKKIILTYKRCTLCSIYNDGNPMNLKDRQHSLTLDGRLKSNDEKKKGRYGIGGFNSRAVLAGNGSQIMTSYDGDNTYQCEINLKKLKDDKESPKNCWTGENSNYRPSWKLIQNSNNYKYGVTKEYNGSLISHNFQLHDVMIHLAKKYSKNIKNGLEIIVYWDDLEYTVPDIYNYDIDKFIIDVYNNKDSGLYYVSHLESSCTLDNKTIQTGKKGVCSKKKSSAIAQYTLNLGSCHNHKIEKSNSVLHTESSLIGYLSSTYINNNINKVLKHIRHRKDKTDKTDKKHYVILDCGKNSIEYEYEEKETKSNIEYFASKCMELFIPDITISMSDDILCYQIFDRTKKFSKGGDLGYKVVYEMFYIDLSYTRLNYNSNNKNIDLSQENKSKVELSKPLSEHINKIIKWKQDCINKSLKETYKYNYDWKPTLPSLEPTPPPREPTPPPREPTPPPREPTPPPKEPTPPPKEPTPPPRELTPPPIEPINVLSHRRGVVSGVELNVELKRVIDIINKNPLNKHYNGDYISLYNQLTKIV